MRLVPLLLLALPAFAAEADPCILRPGDSAAVSAVAAIDGRLELALADGSAALLAGIEVPPGIMPDARAWLAARLEGEGVVLRASGPAPDRWGRTPALAFVPGDAAADSVQVELVEAGLARVRAPTRTPCRAALLAAEAIARAERAGLWGDPATGLLQAEDTAAFAARDGQTVVVEGQVASVAQRGYRTYVNFGPLRFRDFSVAVLKPDAKIFDKNGLPLAALAGHRVRVRGALDLRFGPQVEIADPEAIEVIDIDGRWPQGPP